MTRFFKKHIGSVMMKMARHQRVRIWFQSIAKTLRKNSDRFEFVAGLEAGDLSEEKIERRVGPPGLPEWVMDEMLVLSKIEPTLLLTGQGERKKFSFYELPEYANPGKAYAEAWAGLQGKKFTHVLLAPWLVRGGADLGTLHHIDRLVEKNESNVLLITTENVDSPWGQRIDSRVTWLELGKICSQLNLDEKVSVLTRLVLQLRPEVIHIINSHSAWEMVERHGLSVRQTSRIYASLYCDEYTPDGLVAGYARHYLRSCMIHLEKVISDNSALPDIWSRELGVPREKFATVHFPVNHASSSVFAPVSDAGVQRVLWAGRFTRQKNPGLLAEIAKRTPSIQYDIYGTDQSDGIVFTENVNLKGGFDNFMELPHEQYGCYLNTSLWDGLPNVLLEATACGLPIVSTAVGGILDFLNHENSFLIEDVADIDAICALIHSAVNEPEVARSRWQRAYEKLCAQHSTESMRSELMKIAGYFLPRENMGARKKTMVKRRDRRA